MELALYQPEHGYYERDHSRVGKAGDFYTSVSVGSLFGEMLAGCFAEWMESGGKTGPQNFHLIEAGAHDGKLARDILEAFSKQTQLKSFTYTLIEPSAKRRVWQQQTLRAFGDTFRWASSWDEFQDGKICGVIFSNELMDAMPVHRVGWSAQQNRWFEWMVGFESGQFVWKPGSAELNPALKALIPESLIDASQTHVLPDKFTTEVCPGAVQWWRQAANKLGHGYLLTVDYGLQDHEYLHPARAKGTLRSYTNQRLSDDVLSNPGEQDITAHANFTALENAGLKAGLQTVGTWRQETFLMQILEEKLKRTGGKLDWNASLKSQFQTLTHPGQLGGKFRVLVQKRDAVS